MRGLAIGANDAAIGAFAKTAKGLGAAYEGDDAPIVIKHERGVDVIARGRLRAVDWVENALIISIMHRHVAIYGRLRSTSQSHLQLLDLWRGLRADLFIAEAD